MHQYQKIKKKTEISSTGTFTVITTKEGITEHEKNLEDSAYSVSNRIGAP